MDVAVVIYGLKHTQRRNHSHDWRLILFSGNEIRFYAYDYPDRRVIDHGEIRVWENGIPGLGE